MNQLNKNQSIAMHAIDITYVCSNAIIIIRCFYRHQFIFSIFNTRSDRTMHVSKRATRKVHCKHSHAWYVYSSSVSCLIRFHWFTRSHSSRQTNAPHTHVCIVFVCMHVLCHWVGLLYMHYVACLRLCVSSLFFFFYFLSKVCASVRAWVPAVRMYKYTTLINSILLQSNADVF